MEESNNFSQMIQILMDKVKKDLMTKIENQSNIPQNKELINSLFNLLDYQITLINQIFLFNEKNKDNEDNNNNSIENLIDINKDILVSMIFKFISNINSVFNKAKNNGKNKMSINSKNQNLFKRGKIINVLYSSSNNNNILVSNSFAQNSSPIKKNMEREFNSTISYTLSTPMRRPEPIFDNEKNSYKFLKNKNILYNMKNKNNNNVYDKLYYDKDSRCDHDEKRKNKALMYQSFSKSMKDIFVDLNSDYIKNLFKERNNRDNKRSNYKTRFDN